MKELIKHLWKNNKEEILNRSLLHCHIKGLHSIMLLESPQKTIRLYVAEPNNKLDYSFEQNFPLAVHPHHCNLTLHCVLGSFENISYEVTHNFLSSVDRIKKWRYTSKITEGDIKFELESHNISLIPKSYYILKEGDSIHMEAKELHTVVCPNKNEYTAWLVYEGKEDNTYENVCYTNLNPNDSVEGLYEKPTTLELRYLLEKVFNINNL